MSEMSGMSGMAQKGFAFTGLKKKVEKAPEEFRDLPVKETDMKPSKMTTAGKEARAPATAVKAMFSRPEITRVVKPSVKSVKPLISTQAPPKFTDVEPELPGDLEEQDLEESLEEPLEGIQAPAPKFVFKKKGPSADLEEMGALIREEERKDPYELPAPTYVPESRRGFSEFIKTTYEPFMLEEVGSAKPTPAGEKYPYQKFIREYMRNESPYRGILTYHGLGSGKTCTAIAASEALYSTANKKIIVMTPASLKRNFLKEVSLCGFRHFRLRNFWTSMPKDDAAVRMFATSVLGVSESHLRTASAVWIPDFRKTPEEANYSSLTADEQTEIRKQIISILVWDPVKNPTGRIRFINYNGISAKKLQEMACKTPEADFFDDAVIIIDEIHNVIRLMQGTIDPYLVRMKGVKRIIAHEEIGVEKWRPSLCGTDKKYMRGYLFYRLLLGARNSKIIGLSGTPIINFPEELGIMMNVLHGYIPTVEGIVEQVGSTAQKKITDIATANPYIDYVRASQDAGGSGTKVVLTLLPYGIKKVEEGEGVERVSEYPPVEEIMNSVRTAFEKGGVKFRSVELKATPLLPPIGETFREKFIKAEGVQNNIVLVKRLTGLISYYKGSRADLMPRIKVDEVVRVPMSNFSQRGYIAAREIEVNMEMKKKSSTGELGGVWGEVYEVGTGTKSSNYKMASRQACNFIFPSGVLRPVPKTKKEERAEAEAGGTRNDILDAAPDMDTPEELDEEFPELDDMEDVDAQEAAVVAQEDEAAEMELYTDEVAEQEGGGKEDEMPPEPVPQESKKFVFKKPPPRQAAPPVAVQEVPQESKKFVFKKPLRQAAPEPEATLDPSIMELTSKRPVAPAPVKPAPPVRQAPSQPAALECKAGQKPGESYAQALEKARECLKTIARSSMVLKGPDGLELHSPKFAEMLKRIAAAPGSSLVYSQFLDMEGIGIFRIAMDVNGYCPIEILKTPAGPTFSKRTLESLQKGPAGQPRYMTFSGHEEQDIRRLYLDIFNANFNELPQNLKSVLEEAKFTNNHKGEIARVFCITSAGAEGLSLKCVRAVHIMDPYWNDVRLKQVKGRAIRIGSHLELPEADRDVSIYTYLSVFSDEVQVLKVGENRIDETIRKVDSVEKKDALKHRLPIPPGANTYVITTDERMHLIAERKKAITNALESIMKSAAIDCELNIKENRDGTFKCLPLKGKVGDFLYHPNLDIDIRESASMYSVKEAAEPAPLVKADVLPDFILQKLKGTIYRLRYLRDAAMDTTGFEMYAQDDVGYKKLLGTAGVKDGKPGPPVKWV